MPRSQRLGARVCDYMEIRHRGASVSHRGASVSHRVSDLRFFHRGGRGAVNGYRLVPKPLNGSVVSGPDEIRYKQIIQLKSHQ